MSFLNLVRLQTHYRLLERIHLIILTLCVLCLLQMWSFLSFMFEVLQHAFKVCHARTASFQESRSCFTFCLLDMLRVSEWVSLLLALNHVCFQSMLSSQLQSVVVLTLNWRKEIVSISTCELWWGRICCSELVFISLNVILYSKLAWRVLFKSVYLSQ